MPHVVLTAVVSETSYEVEEGAGAVATLCVDISGASLARVVTVLVSTSDNSATGKKN